MAVAWMLEMMLWGWCQVYARSVVTAHALGNVPRVPTLRHTQPTAVMPHLVLGFPPRAPPSPGTSTTA